MGKSRARKSCYENLRRYNALDDELQACQTQLDLVEAPAVPEEGLVEVPPVPEKGLNAAIDPIMMRIDEILREMDAIANGIFVKGSVYINQVGDMDALLKISEKKGQYRGLVKARPVDGGTKLYFIHKMGKGQFISDMR